MRVAPSILLFLTAARAVYAQASDAAFVPDTVVRVPSGPRVIVLGTDPGGVAALRLSVPLVESPAEAGVGRMLAALAEHRMKGPARQIGARVSARRTPWGLAYSVAGAEVDLEYLTYLLRLAVQEPLPENGVVEAVRAELIGDLDRQMESPGDLLLAELRRAAAPEVAPLAGSRGSIRLLDVARLREVWQRSHRAPSMSLVTMTSADPTVLLAMLQAIGLPARRMAAPLGAPDPGDVRGGPPPLRSWYGEARVDPSVADPHAAVAALLVSRRLAEAGPGVEVGVRLWELRDRTLLVVAGAAQGRRAAASLREAVQTAVGDVLASLDERRVGDAVAEVGREYRTRARTPGGLVELVGRSIDGTGGAFGASEYLAALARVTAASLAVYIDALGTPVVVELLP